MHLESLHLEEFRVYRELDLAIPSAGLRIAGPNGSGKSSIVEAIALLSTARSQRAGSERELIRWGSGTDYGVPPYARCSGRIERSEGGTSLGIELEAGSADRESDDQPSLASGVVRKRCLVDGRPVRAMDLVGRLRSVSFSPEDVAIVSGPPSGRRRLIDVAIAQLDRRYLQALSRYGRVMAQRNGLLKVFARDGIAPSSAQARSQLMFWDDELIDAGHVIVGRRLELVAQLSTLAAVRYAELAGGADFAVDYSTGVVRDAGSLPGTPPRSVRPVADGTVPDDAVVDGTVPDAAVPNDEAIQTAFRSRLAERQADEFRRGVSLVGPHRDDIVLSLDRVPLGTYGSRGQQRLGILALKLAEADLMVAVGGQPPVLLLDDVLSELDPERGRLLIESIARFDAQTIVTATDRSALDATVLGGLPLLQAGAGTLR